MVANHDAAGSSECILADGNAGCPLGLIGLTKGKGPFLITGHIFNIGIVTDGNTAT
jgi:hypothetical protein